MRARTEGSPQSDRKHHVGRSTKARSMRAHTLIFRREERLCERRCSLGRLNPSSTKPANASSTKAAASSISRRRLAHSFSPVRCASSGATWTSPRLGGCRIAGLECGFWALVRSPGALPGASASGQGAGARSAPGVGAAGVTLPSRGHRTPVRLAARAHAAGMDCDFGRSEEDERFVRAAYDAGLVGDKAYHLWTYRDAFVGRELVDWCAGGVARAALVALA